MLFFLSNLILLLFGIKVTYYIESQKATPMYPPLQQIQRVGVKTTEAAVLTLSFVKTLAANLGRDEDLLCVFPTSPACIQGIQKH